MKHICKYASSGCNSPEGECIGMCMPIRQKDHRTFIVTVKTNNQIPDLCDQVANRIWSLEGVADVEAKEISK